MICVFIIAFKAVGQRLIWVWTNTSILSAKHVPIIRNIVVMRIKIVKKMILYFEERSTIHFVNFDLFFIVAIKSVG